MTRLVAEQLKQELLASPDARCFVCGFSFRPLLELHHVVPVSKGGADDMANVLLLCPTCHTLIHLMLRWLGERHGEAVDMYALPLSWREYEVWKPLNPEWDGPRDERAWWLARQGKGWI